jgi:hypothetical protein
MTTSGHRDVLSDLGEEHSGVIGERGEFQTYACDSGVKGLTGDYLGIDVRERGMPRWCQGEPEVCIHWHLLLNRGLSLCAPASRRRAPGITVSETIFPSMRKQAIGRGAVRVTRIAAGFSGRAR